jgi:hypothetical protein
MDDLMNLPPLPRRDKCHIQTDTTPIPLHGLGEELSEVWWRGKQWAVTAYGIEALNGTYVIAADRLDEGMRAGAPLEASICVHMSEKDWVDQDDFVTAWLVALAMHNIRGIDGERIREMVADMYRFA